MRQELIEIYSDTTNNAIMRHPDRKFPGLLIQGDTLHAICRSLDETCSQTRGKIDDEVYSSLNELRNGFWDRLKHYRNTLELHGIELPFNSD